MIKDLQELCTEIERCKKSLIYFARTYCKVTNGKGDCVPPIITKEFKYFSEVDRNTIIDMNDIHNKGVTTFMVIKTLHMLLFSTKPIKIAAIFQTREFILEFSNVMKTIIHNLPEFLIKWFDFISINRITMLNGNFIMLCIPTIKIEEQNINTLFITNQKPNNLYDELWQTVNAMYLDKKITIFGIGQNLNDIVSPHLTKINTRLFLLENLRKHFQYTIIKAKYSFIF